VVPTPGNAATSVASYSHGAGSDHSSDRVASAKSNGSSDRAGNGTADEDRVAANDESSRDGTLPQTGSPRPLFLLLGFLGLGAAGAITYLRLRTA
jgi:LPXTG-motif cell wall-anchored protein